ncbi:amidase [Paracraurococcus lichenis]|uniref:Amidase n=1 Tax=Paracraurococcus lichenis TaxID=3064888 RepID=A0ABT9DZ68_9PROT|nr:amidase [Paracraurococcus sp. LOR1-02]MDO9709201.1 amidase [Paracraurococcus sp. LOR1-02]
MQHLPPETWRWDAADIARAIRLGALSAKEATQDALARLAAVNPAINAVVDPLPDLALAAAEAADAARSRGEALGPLHGVPVTVKVNADMGGRATTNGVVAFKDAIAPEDSAVVGNLRKAGAIVIGRTNTPAFSWRWFTDNDLHGKTLNPWSAGHTPGGSSGGAGAAVAAGIGAVAHGNDIGGSVRYPAYACGVAGLRPSLGRIPAYNPGAKQERSLSAQILSTQGPLARRVRDLRLALEAMAAPDWRDPWQAPVPLEGPPLPRRVALCADPAGTGVHPAVAAAVRAAGEALERAGYVVEEAAPPGFAAVAADWDAFIHAEATVFMAEGFRSLADAKARAIFGVMGERDLPALPDYMRLLAARATHQRAWAAWMQERPLLVIPTSAEPPFPQGLDETDFARVIRAQQPLFPTVLLGLPSVSVPTGVAEGLPMGVQVVAPRWREDLALAAAEAIEAACPMPTPLDPR